MAETRRSGRGSAPEVEEKKPRRAAKAAPEAEEKKPRRAVKAAPEAEEKKPRRAAKAAPEAEEKKPRRAAKAAPEAEEKKPRRTVKAAPEAEEKKPRKAAKAAPEAEEKKPRRTAGTRTRGLTARGRKAGAGETPLPAVEAPGEPTPAARFLTGTEEPRLPEEHLGTLPESYGVDRLVLLPRDPGWMFLYWDLSEATMARAAGRRVVLQLRSRSAAGDEEVRYRDVAQRGRYYAETAPGSREMQAVLTVVDDSGAIEALLWSEWVGVPPAAPRPGTPRFLTVPFDQPLRQGTGKTGRRSRLEGRLLTEEEYLRLFGRAVPGSTPR